MSESDAEVSPDDPMPLLQLCAEYSSVTIDDGLVVADFVAVVVVVVVVLFEVLIRRAVG